MGKNTIFSKANAPSWKKSWLVFMMPALLAMIIPQEAKAENSYWDVGTHANVTWNRAEGTMRIECAVTVLKLDIEKHN